MHGMEIDPQAWITIAKTLQQNLEIILSLIYESSQNLYSCGQRFKYNHQYNQQRIMNFRDLKAHFTPTLLFIYKEQDLA